MRRERLGDALVVASLLVLCGLVVRTGLRISDPQAGFEALDSALFVAVALSSVGVWAWMIGDLISKVARERTSGRVVWLGVLFVFWPLAYLYYFLSYRRRSEVGGGTGEFAGEALSAETVGQRQSEATEKAGPNMRRERLGDVLVVASLLLVCGVVVWSTGRDDHKTVDIVFVVVALLSTFCIWAWMVGDLISKIAREVTKGRVVWLGVLFVLWPLAYLYYFLSYRRTRAAAPRPASE